MAKIESSDNIEVIVGSLKQVNLETAPVASSHNEKTDLNDDDIDIWGEEERSSVGTDDGMAYSSALSREWKQRHEKFHTMGYRDGITSGKEAAAYSVTFSSARTCAQLEALNVSAGPASSTVDLQTLYSVEGWDAYAWAFQADAEDAELSFKNPGMEDDPTCGPIIDNVAIKKLFTPDAPQDNVVINGDFEEGPWMFTNAALGVLLPTNLDESTSSLPGWIIESNRAVRYIDSNHYTVPQGKRAIELLSGKEGIISQMVATTPEKQYSLSFTLGSAGDSCPAPLAVMAFAGDQAENFHYAPTGNTTHMTANLTFTARAERTRVAFYSVYYNTRSDDHSSLCGPVVDEVRVWGVSAAARFGGKGLGLAGYVVAAFVALCLILG